MKDICIFFKKSFVKLESLLASTVVISGKSCKWFLYLMGNPFFQEFNRKVVEGFQVTPLWHQGFIRDDGRFCPLFYFDRANNTVLRTFNSSSFPSAIALVKVEC